MQDGAQPKQWGRSRLLDRPQQVTEIQRLRKVAGQQFLARSQCEILRLDTLASATPPPSPQIHYLFHFPLFWQVTSSGVRILQIPSDLNWKFERDRPLPVIQLRCSKGPE